MKRQFLLFLMFSISTMLVAQTNEELSSQKAAKEAELATLKPVLDEVSGKVGALEAEISALTDQLTPYPRWKNGLNGNLGFNISSFDNWLSKDNSNTTAITIGSAMNGHANADYENAFWRNGFNLTLGWIKFDDKDVPDTEENQDFQVAADAFNITSLYGYKFSEKWAASTLGEYRTALLGGNFNNPGYLDIGAGVTWTPISDLVVVFHPANYNFVFSDDGFNYESSFGTKVVADYTTKITKQIAWKSNLSAFVSYKDNDYSSWTWVNGLSTAVKGIGIGFDFGLRANKQEALAAGKTDNPLQAYWLLGFSYAISSK